MHRRPPSPPARLATALTAISSLAGLALPLTLGTASALPAGSAGLAVVGALAAAASPAAAQPTPSRPKASSARPKARTPARPERRPAPPPSPPYADHPALPALAADLAAQTGLEPDWVQARLAEARRVEAVRRLIMPPPAGTAKNWAAYRDRFIEPRRVAAGLAFWRDHESWLHEAEQRWGVPASLVVGIIGVETFYGRHTGSFRVLDALATLSLDFPTGRRDRTPFFREQLGDFLLWARQEGIDPGSVKGSYAGAIGLPQFMPGSILRWAVDFDGDGHIELMGNGADAIGSVAHYLAAFGWERGRATHHPVLPPVDTADRAALLKPDILPTFTPDEMLARGAELPTAARAEPGPLALVELQNGDAAPSYVIGTRNFYAVTRYNWSAYYAMAVIELGETIAAARAAERAPR